MGFGLQPKNLLGMPWRVAFAMQDAGWILRSAIVWAKGLSFCDSYSGSVMPESVRDRPTSAYEMVFMLSKGATVNLTVQLANLKPEFFHLLHNIGGSPAITSSDWSPAALNHSACVELCVRLASAIFDFAQSQYNFALPPFYSEVWQQCAHDDDRLAAVALPPVHGVVGYATRFLRGDISTKDFLEQLKRLGFALGERNTLLVTDRETVGFLPPSITVDGNATIAVNHAGKICKYDFLHDQIITQSPGKCKYFYDWFAGREAGVPYQRKGGTAPYLAGGADTHGIGSSTFHQMSGTRNWRNVWIIGPKAFKEAHFATFPPELAEKCIIAGTSPYNCPKCGTAWGRVIDHTTAKSKDCPKTLTAHTERGGTGRPVGTVGKSGGGRIEGHTSTLGWRPFCECVQVPKGPLNPKDFDTAPATVLDPFGGSGTTGLAAKSLGRDAILIELNAEYVAMAKKRLGADVTIPMFA